MLIEHTFDHKNHLYLVEGEFVLSTSSVIEMNGMRDMGSIPSAALEYAGHRGSAVHRAIQAYEEDRDVEDAIRQYELENDCGVMETALERMTGYYRFRDKHELLLDGEMEKSYVYRHEGTEQLIGGTPDMPCTIDEHFFVLDVKTSFRNTGMAARQDMLKWKMQLQSYEEILTEGRQKAPQKGILHLHPQCGKQGKSLPPTGYEFHWVPSDDSLLWDSAIRVAMAKISHGYKTK